MEYTDPTNRTVYTPGQKLVYGRDIVQSAIQPDHFLFKKKPGGTAVGNLIRAVANKATGGILGTGANRLPLNQPTINTSAIKSDRERLINATKTSINKSLSNLPQTLQDKATQILTDAEMLPKTKALVDAEKAIAQNKQATSNTGLSFNPMYILGAIGVIIVLIIVSKR